MKINSISIISVMAAAIATTNVNAGTVADFYAGVMVGAGAHTIFANNDSKTDSSMLAGALIGVDIPLLRVEAEYNYLNSSDFNTNSAMLNAYLKMPSTVIMPYAGVGLGMVFGGKYEITDSGVTTKFDLDSVPAYQGMLGITFDLPLLPVKFDLEGRALYAPDIYKVEATNTTPDLLEYNARIKVRYIF